MLQILMVDLLDDLLVPPNNNERSNSYILACIKYVVVGTYLHNLFINRALLPLGLSRLQAILQLRVADMREHMFAAP